jgi:hypothetical protein
MFTSFHSHLPAVVETETGLACASTAARDWVLADAALVRRMAP